MVINNWLRDGFKKTWKIKDLPDIKDKNQTNLIRDSDGDFELTMGSENNSKS